MFNISLMVTEAIHNEAPSRAAIGGLAAPSLAIFLGLVLAIGVNVALAFSDVTPLWAAGLANAVFLYVLAHINHEAVHRNICGSDSRFDGLNEVIGHIGSFFLFLPFPAFRAVHLAHHRLTNHETLDGDMWFARNSWWAIALSCFTILIGYEIRLRRLAALGFVSKRTMSIILLSRLLWVALALFGMMAGYAAEVWMLMIIPALLVMPILAFMFAFIVHHPHESREKMGASNVWLSHRPWLQKALTAVFVFQNYHLVHHLRPRLPFYRYGEEYRRMAGDLKDRKNVRYID